MANVTVMLPAKIFDLKEYPLNEVWSGFSDIKSWSIQNNSF